MSLDKLKNELSRAEKGKLDNITVKQKQELMENLTDVFSHLSKAEKIAHIQEFLDLKQHLKTAFALEKKTSRKISSIQKQIRLANDYQKMIEKDLWVPLSHYLENHKRKEKINKSDFWSRLTQEKAQEHFGVKEIDGKKIILAEGNDFIEDMKYLAHLAKTTNQIKRNDVHLKSPIVQYLLATAKDPNVVLDQFMISQGKVKSFDALKEQHIALDVNTGQIVAYTEQVLSNDKDSKEDENFLPTVSKELKNADLKSVTLSNKKDPIEDAEFEEIKEDGVIVAESNWELWDKKKDFPVVIADFDDADYGVSFAKYCEQNNIRRKDSKKIPWRWGMNPGVEYVDQEWNLLTLLPVKWGADQHDDTGAYTQYQLVKMTNPESEDKKQDKIIKQDHSDEYIDYEEVEDQAKGEWEKQDQKSESSFVDSSKLWDDQEKISKGLESEDKPESSSVPMVIPTPWVLEWKKEKNSDLESENSIDKKEEQELREKHLDWENQASEYVFDLSAVLSDTQNIHEEQARLAAEEVLKAKYADIGKRNLFKKGAYFLQRGRKRKKFIKDFMKNASQDAFGDQVENAASRHSRELQNGLKTIDQKAELVSIPELNLLSRWFIEGSIDEATFQTQFNSLLETNAQIKSALEQVKYKGTDILQNLKLEKEQYKLVNELAQTLDQWGKADQVSTKIEAFIKKYQQNPDFLQAIASDLDKKDLNKLKKYFHHQKAVRKIALENLQIKLKVLTGGKSAYQIDNSENEKSRVHKLGKKLDKIPRYLQVPGYAGAGVLLGLAGGPLGLGVVGTSILTTSTFAATSGFTNFIKKRTHYTKEHNTHEKNLTHDFDAEQTKIAQWQQDLEKKWAKNWRTRYKAKRQLDLYNNSTQKDIIKTEDFTKDLLWFSTSLRPLTSWDRDVLTHLLMQGKARLDVYYETGHNFLASSSKEVVESDMLKLHKAIQLWAEKLGIAYDDIDNQSLISKAEEGEDQVISYKHIKEQLLTDYSTANKHFKSQRRRLASKYGIGSAALSAGTAIGMQYMMGTGMFSTESVSHTVSSTSNASSNANFNLWSHQLAEGNQIHSTVADQFSSLGDKANVVAHYGAGTDATLVRAGSQALWESAYQAKVNAVADQIKHLALSSDQKAAFLKELTNRPWEMDRSKAFTNDYLQGDRCAEGLLQMAKGLADSGNQTLIPDLAYDAGRSIAGNTLHNLGERSFNLGLEITTQAVQNQPGSWSTRFVPIVSFFNTFKKTPKSEEKQDKKSDLDSTIQSKEQNSEAISRSTSEWEWWYPMSDQDRENLDNPSSTAERVAAGAALTGAAAVAVEAQRNPSKARQYRESFKSWAKKLGGKIKESRNKAALKIREKMPTIKEKSKKWREKTKEITHDGVEKTKEIRNSASEKVKEKSPERKEKAKQGREKTKEITKKWAEKTKEKIQSLKNRLFDKEGNEGEKSDLDDFETLKKSEAAKYFLETKGWMQQTDENWYTVSVEKEVLKPKQKIDYHWKVVYLTDKINDHYVIAYIEHNGVLEPRVFRRSNSGGNWHVVPGYDGSRVSKGEFVKNISYEKGTVVHRDFNQILDDILDQNERVSSMEFVMKDAYGKDIPQSAYQEIGKHYDDMPKAAQEFYDETIVYDELIQNEFNVNSTRNNAFVNYQNVEQIKTYYDKLNLSRKMDFSESHIIDSYHSEHKYLGSVENQVMTAKIKSSNPDFDGREVQITISTAQKDGLSWVENMVFSDDSGTSFLTQKNPISAGLLTTKPLEYEIQVPQFVREDPLLEDYMPYIDIRPLMQNNPLIKEWKKIQS